MSAPLFTAVVLIASTGFNADAQTVPRFDAASIKLDRNRPVDRRMKGGPGTNSPGRVTWQLAWLDSMLSEAFEVEIRRISGPSWLSGMDAPLYTLTAVMPPTTSKREFRLMLQAFLIEQFHLKLRHDLKLFPAYDLVVAPGGAKLRAAADPDAPDIGVMGPPKIGADGFPSLRPGHGQLVARNQGYHAVFQSNTMSEFAEQVTNWVTPEGESTHYVLDKTGLTGKYDFRLKFDSNESSVVLGSQAQAAYGVRENSDAGSGLPNIFKAVEQQLGLRLVKTKDIPLDTIVIEHVEKMPAGN